jgi:hypothetical protein
MKSCIHASGGVSQLGIGMSAVFRHLLTNIVELSSSLGSDSLNLVGSVLAELLVRSKLAAQAIAQDKKFREYANNKIKEEVAKTSAEFHDVRDQMAKDRAHADAELSHASARMDAALNAQKALQDKRFAQTVADIAEAKKEANDRVEKFRTSFKVDILNLQGTVDEQTRKLNARTTQLAGVVTSNKLEQAKVNAAVDAELKRMVKIGDERYKEHLKKDEELHSLMAKNKEATATQMEQMAEEFTTEMTKIKDQMAKDRAHAENSLSTATSALYKTLADNQEAQDAANKELTEATRRGELLIGSILCLLVVGEGFVESRSRSREGVLGVCTVLCHLVLDLSHLSGELLGHLLHLSSSRLLVLRHQ